MKSLLFALVVCSILEGAHARGLDGLNRHICLSREADPDTPPDCKRCIDCPPTADVSIPSGMTCSICYGCSTRPDRATPPTDYQVCLDDLAGTGLDPHFIVETNGEKLCFDYTGTSGQVINLIEDDQSETYISAQLHQWDPNRVSNVFSKIMIELGTTEMEFGFQDILVDDELTSWTMTSPFTKDDVTISPIRHDVLSVHSSKTDVALTVTRHKGELMGYYLGVYVTDKGQISRDASGMLGQFFFAGMTIESEYMTLTFPNAPSKTVPVSLEKKYAIGSIEGDEECWHYDSRNDNSLTGDDAKIGNSLLGEFEQYIVDEE